MMMLWYHLFGLEDMDDLAHHIFFIEGHSLSNLMARACNPVFLFLILGGYGLYAVYQKGQDHHHVSRLVKLYKHHWMILLLVLPPVLLLNGRSYLGSWTNIVSNLIALDPTWNETLWFLLPYCLLSFSYPLAVQGHRPLRLRGFGHHHIRTLHCGLLYVLKARQHGLSSRIGYLSQRDSLFVFRLLLRSSHTQIQHAYTLAAAPYAIVDGRRRTGLGRCRTYRHEHKSHRPILQLRHRLVDATNQAPKAHYPLRRAHRAPLYEYMDDTRLAVQHLLYFLYLRFPLPYCHFCRAFDNEPGRVVCGQLPCPSYRAVSTRSLSAATMIRAASSGATRSPKRRTTSS